MPTTNFVLHWVTGRTETHRYDESLRSIDLVTKDAYEPTLPLSVVVHIDYQKAPNVIQRFGDVKKLITQTLDPMLSAYFRDVAHKRTMLELLQDRDSIQHESSKRARPEVPQLRHRVRRRPDRQARHRGGGGKIETLLEQLRLRQLSLEQVETYSKQVTAAQNLRVLNEAQAQAQMQTQLSNSLVQIRIAENEAEAQLARARKQAEQVVVTAQAESQAAHPGRSRRRCPDPPGRVLRGLGAAAARSSRSRTRGSTPCRSWPRAWRKCTQPLVPERVFIAGGPAATARGRQQLTGAGVSRPATGSWACSSACSSPRNRASSSSSQRPSRTPIDFTEQVTRQAMEAIQQAVGAGAVPRRHRGNGIAAARRSPPAGGSSPRWPGGPRRRQ